MTSVNTYLYHVWFVAHLANLCHVAQLLLYQSTLKQDQHHKRKERVIPVLVQAPEGNTQHLKYKKWSCGSFFEQLHELWHYHVEPISTNNMIRGYQSIYIFIQQQIDHLTASKWLKYLVWTLCKSSLLQYYNKIT